MSRNGRAGEQDSICRRPDKAPEMPKDCPICLEPLFDDEGLAKENPVAKINCIHLIHSSCLEDTKKLNKDGKRYGFSGFDGTPCSGCPICGQGASIWIAYEEAAAFPLFWMQRIQSCLDQIGPHYGPVTIKKVKELLLSDGGLTVAQKKFISKAKDYGDDGFMGGVINGSTPVVKETVGGGPSKGGYIRISCESGVWDYDRGAKTLWCHYWGVPTHPDREIFWMRVAFIMIVVVFIFALFDDPSIV